MNIILFNGPPSSGKDTAARHVFDNWSGIEFSSVFDCWFERMSRPNKEAFAAITATELDEFGNNLTYERIKETPLELFNGKSYRQWQIDFSESFMKPLYGQNIFGRLWVSRAKQGMPTNANDTFLVPDCGFEIEARTLRDGFPRAGILLIRIHREGFTFKGDSRDYLTGTSYGVAVLDVTNDGTEAEYLRKIEKHVKEFIS